MEKKKNNFIKQLDNIEPDAKLGNQFDYSKKVVPGNPDDSAAHMKTMFNKLKSTSGKSNLVKETAKHIANRRSK